MCACTRIYLYMHRLPVCKYMSTDVYIYKYTRIHIYPYTCKHVCRYICINIYDIRYSGYMLDTVARYSPYKPGMIERDKRQPQ